MNLENLDTPNVVINEAIVEQNIQRVQSFFDGLGIAFRPHIKTHKSIEIAKLSFGYSLRNCALSVLATVVSTPSSELIYSFCKKTSPKRKSAYYSQSLLAFHFYHFYNFQSLLSFHCYDVISNLF